MKLDVERFCSLSRSSDFQEWLKSVAMDFYTDLMEHLKLGKGCGSNKNKMLMIYDQLKQRNLGDSLVEFVKKFYPYVLIRDDGLPIKLVTNKKVALTRAGETEPFQVSTVAAEVQVKTKPIVLTTEEANIHKVFPIYRPGFFMLPQQMIMIGKTQEEVNNLVVDFIRQKVSTDFIILKSDKFWHGYIEYFDKQFTDKAPLISKSTRPISLYRQKYGFK